MITWDDIVADFNAYDKMPTKPSNMRKYKTGEIIDEDMTVRWNKEEIIRRNDAYNKAVSECNTKRNLARDAVHKKIYAYIMESLGKNCTEAKAKAIFSLAWSYGHSYGLSEVHCYLTEIMDLADILLNDKKSQ